MLLLAALQDKLMLYLAPRPQMPSPWGGVVYVNYSFGLLGSRDSEKLSEL